MTISAPSTTHAGSADRTTNDDRAGPFRHVLVGVDGTESGRDAIALGNVLRGAGGELTLAHVVLSPGAIYGDFSATPPDERCRALLEQERQATQVTAQLSGVIASTVGRGLHGLANEHGADLVVVGSCRRGRVGRVLLGDDARTTVGAASCPVAVAPHGYRRWSHVLNTIGVAYDDTDEAAAALAVARRLANEDRRRLSAITVVTPVSITAGGFGGLAPEWRNLTDTLVDAAHERLGALEGVEDRQVMVGDVGDELVDYGDEVDLLVVGSRRHGPVRRVILGSTSLHLTRAARCPLLVVPRPQPGTRAEGA
jgi:nucleotide-binding universal stress UspA family protein